MSATTSVKSQEQKRPTFRKIMTWSSKTKDKELLPTHGYDSAPDDSQQPVPPSPTPSTRSIRSNNRPSLFRAFARRNSTRSEHSVRSRSPTSPRPSTEYGIAEDFRSSSPTPSRDSMVFERDVETHDHLSVHEAIDAIPPMLEKAAEAFATIDDGVLVITDNSGDEPILSEEASSNEYTKNALQETDAIKRLSLADMADIISNRTPSPGPYDPKPTIAETLRVTTPREMRDLAGVHDKQWK